MNRRAYSSDLREEEWLERYQTIFALSPDFIYRTDTTGKILGANPALLERTGLSLEHIEQMHFMDLFAGDSPREEAVWASTSCGNCWRCWGSTGLTIHKIGKWFRRFAR